MSRLQRPTGRSTPQTHGAANIAFRGSELGDRRDPLGFREPMRSAYQNSLPSPPHDIENDDANVGRIARKKSLVRPDREKIEPGHRLWHYRTHAAGTQGESTG